MKLFLKVLFYLLRNIDIFVDKFLSKYRKYHFNVMKKSNNNKAGNIFIFCVYDPIIGRADLQSFFKKIRKNHLLIIVSNSDFITSYKDHCDCLISVSKTGRDFLCYKAGYDFINKNLKIKFKRITFANDSVWYFKRKQQSLLNRISGNKNYALEKNYDTSPHISGYFFSIYERESINSLKKLLSKNLNYKSRYNNIYNCEHLLLKNIKKSFSTLETKIIDIIPKSYQLSLFSYSKNLYVLKGDVILRSKLLDQNITQIISTCCLNNNEKELCEKWVIEKTKTLNKGMLKKLDYYFYRAMIFKLEQRMKNL